MGYRIVVTERPGPRKFHTLIQFRDPLMEGARRQKITREAVFCLPAVPRRQLAPAAGAAMIRPSQLPGRWGAQARGRLEVGEAPAAAVVDPDFGRHCVAHVSGTVVWSVKRRDGCHYCDVPIRPYFHAGQIALELDSAVTGLPQIPQLRGFVHDGHPWGPC